MTVHYPATDLASLATRLSSPEPLLVACLCAAWCGTCTEYLPKFTALAASLPQHVFAWVDIEEHPDLLDDEDIEDFPTLLVQDASRTLFYGPMLPHIGHLERLLEALAADPSPAAAPGTAPALRHTLVNT